jgi:hypothetical protein
MIKQCVLHVIENININLVLYEFSYKDDVHVVGPQFTGWDICSTVWCLAVGGWMESWCLAVGGWMESNVELWTL